METCALQVGWLLHSRCPRCSGVHVVFEAVGVLFWSPLLARPREVLLAYVGLGGVQDAMSAEAAQLWTSLTLSCLEP